MWASNTVLNENQSSSGLNTRTWGPAALVQVPDADQRQSHVYQCLGRDYKMWSHANKASFSLQCKFNLSSSCHDTQRILEMQSNCFSGSFDGHTEFSFRNVLGKSDSVQKNSWAQLYSSLDNLKWVFPIRLVSSLLLVWPGIVAQSLRKTSWWVPNWRSEYVSAASWTGKTFKLKFSENWNIHKNVRTYIGSFKA